MADLLSPKQMKAVHALMVGASLASAATAAGVSERTLWRWRQSPAFHAELQARAGELLDGTTRQLAAVMSNAPSVLHKLMTDKESPPGVRLAAARIALDAGLRLIELRSIMARIEALEARQ